MFFLYTIVMATKTDLLKKIRDDVIAFKDSPLYKYRSENKYFPVLGEGNHDAEIVFIGEAPGKNEAMTGRPFCGAAGKILDELLASINLDRKDIYITNIVKDRPPENRDPLPSEIEAYAPYLDKQLQIIKPKVLATLGRFSMVYIMEKAGLHQEVLPISKAHGKPFEADLGYGKVNIIPLYHPAAAIYNRELKATLLEDFKQLKKYAK
jgi:uracil-DNA glycosylase